jgi:hypothetical protein
LLELSDVLLEFVGELNDVEWSCVCQRFELLVDRLGVRNSTLAPESLIKIDPTINLRFWFFLTARLTLPGKSKDAMAYVKSCDVVDRHILRRAYSILSDSKKYKSKEWVEELRLSKLARENDFFVFRRRFRSRRIPTGIAEQVLSEPDLYPSSLLAECADSISHRVLARAKKVSDVASSERWFLAVDG